MNYCGFDFGTSNSTIGIVKNNKITMVPLEKSNVVLRSAIFFDHEGEFIPYERDAVLKHVSYGNDAVLKYISGVEGRLMLALKSILGTQLMSENTRVFENKTMDYTDILGYLIKYIKSKAESYSNSEIDSVVFGRPVHFNDSDPVVDRLAQDTLEEIARKQGYKNIVFQYEPVAAAITFEHSCKKEELAFIVDMGGGTSDFSIIKVNPNKSYSENNILASAGVHIGGTDFDYVLNYNKVMPHLGNGTFMRITNGSVIPLPIGYYRDLSQWHTINKLYAPQIINKIKNGLLYALDKEKTGRLIRVLDNRLGHHISESVEESKIHLTDVEVVQMNLEYIDQGLIVDISKQEFDEMIEKYIIQIKDTISSMLLDAEINSKDITVIYFTGGTSKIKSIQHEVTKMFENAKVVEGDTFSSVGSGLTIDAQRKFR